MKRLDFKCMAWAVIATLFAFTACDDSDTKPGDGDGDPDENTELQGELTGTRTLKEGVTYSLSGGYQVKSGGKLIIEPGVTIVAKDDNTVDYILIEQGAQIDAQGTASKPIIMTSERKEAGAWGGLHICGKAPINLGTTGRSEIGDLPYGGNAPGDNSGTMRYIRLEYTGFIFTEDKEANGVTFYGVGNGTTVEYLQAYKGSDDGFEWFGGTVDAKYLVSTDCSDDSFDWTEGWSGRAQFLVAYQGAESSIGYDCDCLIEADNHATNLEATPVSCPTLANLTLVGNNSTAGTRGIRLRAGTHAKIYNTLVIGKSRSLSTETAETEESLVDGSSILDYVQVASVGFSGDGGYSEALFLGNANNSISAATFANNYVGTVAGGKDMSTVDNFFAAANYKGAIQTGSDWTAGWTRK